MLSTRGQTNLASKKKMMPKLTICAMKQTGVNT